jgi:hypothetical protein
MLSFYRYQNQSHLSLTTLVSFLKKLILLLGIIADYVEHILSDNVKYRYSLCSHIHKYSVFLTLMLGNFVLTDNSLVLLNRQLRYSPIINKLVIPVYKQTCFLMLLCQNVDNSTKHLYFPIIKKEPSIAGPFILFL